MEERKSRIAPRGGVLGRSNVKQRRPVIDARRQSQATSEATNARITNKPKTLKDIQLINHAFEQHFIFTSLSEDNREAVIEAMKYFELGSGKVLFEENQPAKYFFVLVTGKMEVIINLKRVNILNIGQGFGELALLHDTPRSATIKAVEKCTLWGLDRKSFRDAVASVNAVNYSENKAFIDTVPLLQALTNAQKDTMVGAFDSHKFSDGNRIVHEGDRGDLFYIIKDGTVSCTQGGQEIRRLGRGDFFGELALLYNAPRSATVTACGEVKCVSLGRETLNELLGSELQQIIYRNSQRMSMEQNEIMRKLSKDQVEEVCNALVVTGYTDGQVVIPRGTNFGDKLWIVVKGELKRAAATRSIFADRFQCIGEEWITEDNPSGRFDDDIVAIDDPEVAEITREQFEKAIGGSFEQATAFNEAAEVLNQVQLLHGLPNNRFLALVAALTVQTFRDGDVILRESNQGESFYIVKSGKVDVFKNRAKIRTITKNDYFGERAIIFNDFRSASVVAVGQVECWTISKEEFLGLMDESIRGQLLSRIELQDDQVDWDMMKISKLLGTGMFGNVYLAVHQEKRTLYALKTVTRNKIEKYQIQENIQLERSVLLQLDHNMILKLVKTFKDQKRIYFLTEYVKGMDLFDVLRDMGLLNNGDARFYMACLIEIMQHVHERGIVYRDLKPENIMVDEQGYPKLIDFGTAKNVTGRTYTIVGTPHYMAPEIIVGKGYGLAVDLWSLGIILYEFVCGGVPFGEDQEDPYAIYEKVLERRLRYPSFFDSKSPTRAFIETLLDKNPNARNLGDYSKLKAHPWLQAIDWSQLIRREIQPPYMPTVRNLDRDVNVALASKVVPEDVFRNNESDTDERVRDSQPGWDDAF